MPALDRPKTARVAAIVTCHNYGAYLRECLDSLLAQTVRPCEIIVVDDASTDETPAIARAYPDVRYLRTEHGDPHLARRDGAGVRIMGLGPSLPGLWAARSREAAALGAISMPRTTIEIQVRAGGQWIPGELTSDPDTGLPVVSVAGTHRLLGPGEVAYIRQRRMVAPNRTHRTNAAAWQREPCGQSQIGFGVLRLRT